MTAPPEDEAAAPFDATRLDQYSVAELDQQPFGIIGLDAAGKILRYNLAEARFARLDRVSVLGKRFFSQVAPCTATPEFEGRFKTFISSTAPTLRFEYLFDFKFGAQQVEIELVRGQAGRFWLLVNRRKLMPARSNPFRPAPTQAELAPGESQRGVLRDLAQQRRVTVAAPFFAAMRSTWDLVAPRGWPAFCVEWGIKWGRLAVVDLETQAQETVDKSLRELPMQQVLSILAAYLSQQGWGVLSADFTVARQGAFVLSVDRCAFGESVGFSEVPRCQIFAGFFRALFSHLSAKPLTVHEVSCAAQGYSRCSFVVASLARRAALEEALAQADGEVDAVLRIFLGESLARETPAGAFLDGVGGTTGQR